MYIRFLENLFKFLFQVIRNFQLFIHILLIFLEFSFPYSHKIVDVEHLQKDFFWFKDIVQNVTHCSQKAAVVFPLVWGPFLRKQRFSFPALLDKVFDWC